MRIDNNGSPSNLKQDPCYTSVYQYSWDETKKLTGEAGNFGPTYKVRSVVHYCIFLRSLRAFYYYFARA